MRWRFTVWGRVVTAPAVANGTVYLTGQDNNLYAVDAITGRLRWVFKTPESPDDPRRFFTIAGLQGKYEVAGLGTSSPAVVNDTVFFGSSLGYIYAVNAHTGRLIWRYLTQKMIGKPSTLGGITTFSEYVPFYSASVSHGTVYLGSCFSAYVYALRAQTGHLLWRFATTWHSGAGEADTGCSPAIANGLVYVASSYAAPSSTVFALNATTGRSRWHFTLKYPSVLSSPTAFGGLIYISSESGLDALNGETGLKVWHFAPEGGYSISSQAVVDGVVYATSDDGNLYALGARTGTKLWIFKTHSAMELLPLVASFAQSPLHSASNVSIPATNSSHYRGMLLLAL